MSRYYVDIRLRDAALQRMLPAIIFAAAATVSPLIRLLPPIMPRRVFYFRHYGYAIATRHAMPFTCYAVLRCHWLSDTADTLLLSLMPAAGYAMLMILRLLTLPLLISPSRHAADDATPLPPLRRYAMILCHHATFTPRCRRSLWLLLPALMAPLPIFRHFAFFY